MIKRKQAGISLVEILVSLVISLFLLGGIVQVYLGNKTSFKFTNAIAEIQENGRFALDTMSQDLRLANEWSCVAFDPDDTTNINDTLNALNVPGYDTDWHDFVNEDAIEGTNNTGLNGSDTIIVRGGKPGQANVEADTATNAFEPAGVQQLFTTPIRTLEAGDIILVGRCGANDLLIAAEADILPVTGINNADPAQTQINLGATKSQMFQNDATVIELQTVSYSIADSVDNPGTPVLIRNEFNNPIPQELVEGVQDLQVLYGVDSDGDGFPNQYLDADNVPDFDDVVAARIMLLLQSIDDNVAEAPQTYTFNGVQVTPNDRRIRQAFTMTVALRNR